MQLPASLDAVDDAEKRRGEAGRHEDVEKSHHREVSSRTRILTSDPKRSCRYRMAASREMFFVIICSSCIQLMVLGGFPRHRRSGVSAGCRPAIVRWVRIDYRSFSMMHSPHCPAISARAPRSVLEHPTGVLWTMLPCSSLRTLHTLYIFNSFPACWPVVVCCRFAGDMG